MSLATGYYINNVDIGEYLNQKVEKLNVQMTFNDPSTPSTFTILLPKYGTYLFLFSNTNNSNSGYYSSYIYLNSSNINIRTYATSSFNVSCIFTVIKLDGKPSLTVAGTPSTGNQNGLYNALFLYLGG
jgi:hypothetical protein